MGLCRPVCCVLCESSHTSIAHVVLRRYQAYCRTHRMAWTRPQPRPRPTTAHNTNIIFAAKPWVDFDLLLLHRLGMEWLLLMARCLLTFSSYRPNVIGLKWIRRRRDRRPETKKEWYRIDFPSKTREIKWSPTNALRNRPNTTTTIRFFSSVARLSFTTACRAHAKFHSAEKNQSDSNEKPLIRAYLLQTAKPTELSGVLCQVAWHARPTTCATTTSTRHNVCKFLHSFYYSALCGLRNSMCMCLVLCCPNATRFTVLAA